MRINVLETFLDGRDRYERGEVRNVPEAKGAYFVGLGWAEDADGQVPTGKREGGPLKLDIHGAGHDTGDTLGG